MTKSNRGFFSNQGDATLRQMIRSRRVQLIRNFTYVHLICKFQEDPIKPELVMLMTKSNRGFFRNQGGAALRQMIRSGQASNQSEISSMSTSKLQEDPIKTEQVVLMTKSNRGFFQQSRDVTKTKENI